MHGAYLIGILDGTSIQPFEMIHVEMVDKTKEEVENRAYVQWIAHDQQVLSQGWTLGCNLDIGQLLSRRELFVAHIHTLVAILILEPCCLG